MGGMRSVDTETPAVCFGIPTAGRGLVKRGSIPPAARHDLQFVTSRSSVVADAFFSQRGTACEGGDVRRALGKPGIGSRTSCFNFLCFSSISCKMRKILFDWLTYLVCESSWRNLLLILCSALSATLRWLWRRSPGTSALQTNTFPLYSSFLICSYLNNQKHTYISSIRV